ncbi:tyrosine-type recombinase/integrase [Faecalitalea cylindroides]|jgi:integrase/recombinase XerD|uniref:tyrosine-type recombinase/integrase n=1 Tax=Faecalitalea cylindroides TaxID=39483 RepID=UPI0019585C3A|nr:tyrosine-type recombinase/integrase [Faecalitalea cylindroides]MBM6811296.1 tyrosine-type recombinase/integrase [Faecalitalea cylindroides]
MKQEIIEARQELSKRLNSNLYYEFIQFLDVKKNTLETYKKGLKQFFIYLLENEIQEPTRKDVISFRDYIKETHKAGTAQTYLASVRAFFKWTDSEGYYPNIAHYVKSVKQEKGFKKDYLTSEQAKDVLNAISRTTVAGLRDYAIISLMLTTGLRTVEVSRANVDDLRTLGNSTVLYIQGKGHDTKDDYVKITKPVEHAIRTYLKAVQAQSDSPMFTSLDNKTKGNRLTTRSLSRICKKYMVKAGYDSERLTAHSFRHTSVTLALLNGNTLEQVQQMARHKNINTTMIYNHALQKEKNPCYDSVSNALFGA